MDYFTPRFRRQDEGSVPILVLLITSLLATAAWSFPGSVDAVVGNSRDEGCALRASLAAEAGMEYAQRRLALEPIWTGTGESGVRMGNSTAYFIVKAISVPYWKEDAEDRDYLLRFVRVSGLDGAAQSQLAATMEVHPSKGGTADLALIFLGKNCHMLRTDVLGDALFVDGNTNLVQSSISGTLYKYREDNGTYQDLGEEEVIIDNAVAPCYDLSGFLTPGSGKTIYTGVTNLTDVYLENTAVFRLNPGEKLTLSACTFVGGVVIDCPTKFDIRTGYRNRVELSDGTIIGGGSSGAEANIGLLAPGAELTSAPSTSYTIHGFTYVNAIGAMENTAFYGQLVILNQVSDLKESTIVYDETVAMAPPQSVGFGKSSGITNILAMYEDFN